MKTLLIIDVQHDFLPGGRLEVPRGDKIIPRINQLIDAVDLVVATQDWHPKNHVSFASNHPNHTAFETIHIDGNSQTLWPDHCVQGNRGAQFPEALKTHPIEAIFRKGTNPKIDSYSGFYDNAHLKIYRIGSLFTRKRYR